jgi:hypothetical protein
MMYQVYFVDAGSQPPDPADLLRLSASCAARKLRQPHQVALTAPRWPLGGIA